jgi:hypothetical protein
MINLNQSDARLAWTQEHFFFPWPEKATTHGAA